MEEQTSKLRARELRQLFKAHMYVAGGCKNSFRPRQSVYLRLLQVRDVPGSALR